MSETGGPAEGTFIDSLEQVRNIIPQPTLIDSLEQVHTHYTTIYTY